MPTIPCVEPQVIVAGDSAQWLRTLQDYPADQGWTLRYILAANGQVPIIIEATADGANHLISVPPATTASWVAGGYNWSSYVTNGTDRFTIESGFITVQPDPTTLTADSDPRTANQKILAQIQAALASELSNPLSEYRIGDRTVKRDPATKSELLRMESIYKRRVALEQGAAPLSMTPITFKGEFGIPFGGYGGRV